MIIHDGGGVESLALINIMLIWREIMWRSSPKKRGEKSKVSRVSRALSAVLCVSTSSIKHSNGIRKGVGKIWKNYPQGFYVINKRKLKRRGRESSLSPLQQASVGLVEFGVFIFSECRVCVISTFARYLLLSPRFFKLLVMSSSFSTSSLDGADEVKSFVDENLLFDIKVFQSKKD